MRRYGADVISLKCSQCNAELLPEARFCRRCGALVTAVNAAEAINSSELPTAIFDQREGPATQNLTPRVTSPETPRQPVMAAVNATQAKAGKRRRLVLVGVVSLLLLCGILAAVAYVTMTSGGGTTDDTALIYPGSETIVDLSSGDGRSIHLRTDYSLEQVVTWYENSIKPTKTMRLTSTSVVLKNAKVTVTVASEAGKTNILIKQIK